jgi:four helix bundle protein
MNIATFEDIIAWQKGRELYTCLYRDLYSSSNFSFKDQLLRAALSITNNIAEGFDRGSNRELKQFLIIARGSTAEVRSMLLIDENIRFFAPENRRRYIKTSKDVSRLLTKFIQSISVQNTNNRLRTTKSDI